MKRLTCFVCLLLLTTFSGYFATAQTAPAPGTDAAERANRNATGKSNSKSSRAAFAATTAAASAAVRTSPFDPPEDGDQSFSNDSGPGLDTGCSFRSDGPLVFNVEIKRFVGEINPDGTLKNADALIAAGAISRTVKLIMPNYDVDSSASFSGVAPERDRVSINGEAVGFLEGENNQWVLNSFEIDVRKIKFAERGADGSEPTGGINEIRIDIDTANASESWCTATDWANGSFKALSPIILIHGNNSTGAFFDRQQFTDELLAQGVLKFDNSINLAAGAPSPGGTFIANNARELNQKIPAIVRSYGVKSVHLIAHSKGGLDSRAYLADYQRRYQKEFKILSLTTLSTPHDGSVAADVSIERQAAAQQVGNLGKIEFEGFPDYLRRLTFVMEKALGVDDGRRNLTTNYVTNTFGRANVPKLSGLGVTFNTVAANADRNNNKQIDSTPDEFSGLRIEDKYLRGLFAVNEDAAAAVPNLIYQILYKTSGVNVTYRKDCFLRICRNIAVISSIDHQNPQKNDTLVTEASASGQNSIFALRTFHHMFDGIDGKDHGTVGGRDSAKKVLPWLLYIDRQNKNK
jgi:pimeloyl-ACP methyl ester carboxylesterase